MGIYYEKMLLKRNSGVFYKYYYYQEPQRDCLRIISKLDHFVL